MESEFLQILQIFPWKISAVNLFIPQNNFFYGIFQISVDNFHRFFHDNIILHSMEFKVSVYFLLIFPWNCENIGNSIFQFSSGKIPWKKSV